MSLFRFLLDGTNQLWDASHQMKKPWLPCKKAQNQWVSSSTPQYLLFTPDIKKAPPPLPAIVAPIRIKALPHLSPPLNTKALFSSIIQELFWNKRIGWSFFFWKQIWSLQSIKHKEEPISFALMLHSSLSVQRRSYNIRNATCWLSVGKREKKKKRGTLSIPFRTFVWEMFISWRMPALFLVSFYHLRNAYFDDDELEMNCFYVPAYFGFSLITTII